MIKFIYCVRRQPDLDPDAFRDYWLKQHGPLVKSLASALKAQRYVQSHTLDTPLNAAAQQLRGTSEPPYDGMTEIWWNSAEDLMAALSTPEGQEANRTLGYFFSENSTSEQHFNPIVPDTDLHAGSVGFGRKGKAWGWGLGGAAHFRAVENSKKQRIHLSGRGKRSWQISVFHTRCHLFHQSLLLTGRRTKLTQLNLCAVC